MVNLNDLLTTALLQNEPKLAKEDNHKNYIFSLLITLHNFTILYRLNEEKPSII